MADSGLISVIIPLKNVEKYLERCVNSVLSQTMTLECILVDDSSTDSSLAICERLAAADSRVRVMQNAGRGCSAGRNTGMEAANGEYIVFIDSDDYIAPGFLETLKTLLETNPDCDAACCSFLTTDADGNPYSDEAVGECGNTCEEQAKQIGAADVLDGIITPGSDLNRDLIPIWNKLYRREALSGLSFRVGMLHEDEFFATDFCTSLHSRSGSIVYTKQKLYYYRQQANSITHVTDPVKRAKRRIMATTAFSERVDAYHQAVPELFEKVMHCFLQRCGMYCAETACAAGNKSVWMQRKEIWKLYKKQYLHYRSEITPKERIKGALFICMPVVYSRFAMRKCKNSSHAAIWEEDRL